MLVPAVADAGPLLVIVRSAVDVTVVTAVALSLPGLVSAFGPEMVAVLLRVPVALGLMFSVSLNCALPPEAKLPIEQVTLPLLPILGELQTNVGPAFCTIETNVVADSNGSVHVVGAAESRTVV